MSEFIIDPEGAERFFTGSGKALEHAEALEHLTGLTDEEANSHIEGLLSALGSFSTKDMMSGIGVVINGLENQMAESPTQTREEH